jgi:RNase P/RNase MRP subunit p30
MGGPSPEKGPGNRRQLQIDTTQKRLKAIPFQMPTESSFAVNRTVVDAHHARQVALLINFNTTNLTDGIRRRVL